MPVDRGRTKEEVAGEAWMAMYRFILGGEGQRNFHDACEHTGLAPGVLKTLLSLHPGQPQSMGELAETFRCDPSYVTSLVDGLESTGLAERRPHPGDRRVKDVVLTAAGEHRRDEAEKILSQPPEALDRLSFTELRQFRDLIEKIVGA